MKNQRKAGVVLAYLSIGVNMLIQLIYTPVMLRLLGQSEYGVYQIVISAVGYLGLLNFGFTGAYVRFFEKYRAAGEEKEIERLNGLFLIIMLVLGAICFGAGMFLADGLGFFFGSKLCSEELLLAKKLTRILVLNMSLTFPFGLFDCYMVALERFRVQKLVLLLKTVSNPFLALPLLFSGYGSVGMVWVTALLTIAAGGFQVIYCLGGLKLRFCFTGLRLGMLREIWVFCFYIFLNQVVDQVNWSVDKVLLGALMGTGIVAVYAVAGMFNSIYMQFSTAISNVFLPRVNRMAAEHADDRAFTELFTRVGRLQFMVLGLVLSGFVFFGRAFIGFYAGEGYEEAYDIALFLLVPVTIPLIQNLGIEIQRAKNLHRFRSLLYLAAALANVAVSVPLIRVFGGTGAAMGTMLSLVICNVLIMNLYYQKVIGLDMKFFWCRIGKLVLAMLPAFLGGFVIVRVLPVERIAYFLPGVILYSVLYGGSVYLFGMKDEERNLIKGLGRRGKG